MIDIETFKKLISEVKDRDENADSFNKLGFSVYESILYEFGDKMFDRFINTLFTEEGVDWIYWWLYEKEGNPHIKAAYNEYGSEIPMETVEDLWNMLKEYRK